METNEIVPDVIDAAPKALATVAYASRVLDDLGKELEPFQVKDQPKVSWEAENGCLYSVLMIDPDAPSREKPTLREIAHWLVINIPDSQLANGQTVIEYIGPGPPEGTGLHRYVILVFKQKHKIITDLFIPKSIRTGRLNVRTRDYISKYQLGDPIAGNFFLAQCDNYVREIRAKL